MKKTICIAFFAIFWSILAFAQQDRIVKGQVEDANGDPLVGVAVYEKGSNQGTMTDSEGQYSISVGSDDSYVVFSMLGYEQAEERVGRRSIINIVMTEERGKVK